ncbi:hypothetical protein ACWEQ1_00275 [Streptomyces nodosus]
MAEIRPQSELFVLWHARHLAVEEDGKAIHRDPDSSMHLDEEEWRILGICSDREMAEVWGQGAKQLPGFRDELDCFSISPLMLDEDLWTDGYFTEYPDGTQRD